ncbi:outer membrane protein assembly factor BamA [Candidatus Dependentiae bacterium]|nr:outer membrane protein assembly factor BamA [Candidatus Dependentiae bacterium]
MIPVMNRRTVYTATLCISLFIPVMKAELEQTSPKLGAIETVRPEETDYYNNDAEDIALMAEEEFQRRQEDPLDTNDETQEEFENAVENAHTPRIIRDIIVVGNKLVSNEAILHYVPYKRGEIFDPRKAGSLIRTLYENIKRFKNIQVLGELVDDDGIRLYLVVEEKPTIKEIVFKGNNSLTEKEIKKKINFDIQAIEEAELKRYILQLQRLYRDKNFHQAQITSTIELDELNRARVIFTIHEGHKTLVSQIQFAGNKHISSKELRGILYTREDWLLGFLDGAGNYQPEKLEADKHLVEQYYQNHGFLKAKVVDADVILDKATNKFLLTFHIEEGNCFTISEVTLDGKGILNEEYLCHNLPIQAGDLYSREKIADTIKTLEMLWGNLGYIFAHIDPSILPDEDTQTVKVSFDADPGNKVFLNKITILGNKKTRDRIIRRRLLLEEGCLISHFGMEESKNRVEALGYFDVRDGVNWKVRRLDSEHADLDLVVKEIKTGHANIKLGFGGSAVSLSNPASGASISAELSDSNLLGSGLQFTFQGTISKEEQSIFFNLTEPWLFDKPILSAFDLYHRRPSYDEFKNTEPVNERLTGGGLTVGIITPLLFETQVLGKIGIDALDYAKRPISHIRDRDIATVKANLEYQRVLDKLFQPVDFMWFSLLLSQDKRNNPMHPYRGIRWTLASRIGLPSLGSDVGFHKLDLDFHWWTPLIGVHDLILHAHTYLGIITSFKNKITPYRELFHIGGPASVRGFLFGQLSPQFLQDSIGGKKAFFVNLELIFPVTADFSTKGLVFYDGGCGWDNPYADEISKEFLRNNGFNYRHAVGIGVRLLKPAPVRIDWGFKLDRRKKFKESAHEVHFSMSYDW